jgi:chemotaxis protein MotB
MIPLMKRIIVPVIVLLMATTLVHAQKKSDLLKEIDDLNAKLRTTQSELAESQTSAKVSEAKAASFEAQMLEVQKTNASLLNNLNNFTAASTEKSDNISKTLTSLKLKEAQLGQIKDVLNANDSTALAVLTDFKRVLGENAEITVENGAVTVVLKNTFLFGAGNKTELAGKEAKDFLGKIASVVNNNPTMDVGIESQGPEGWELAAKRVASIAQVLDKDYQVPQDRLLPIGKPGTATSTYIRVYPKFNEFYLNIWNSMKNKN